MIMDEFKTVENSDTIKDPILLKQKQDVTQMRASLLACGENPVTTTIALQNITVLRVYHQVARIIKYLDMMDKIEDKLYQSLDYQLDTMDLYEMDSLATLLSIQERLQKNIIDSHKLLQPYLNLEELNLNSMIVSTTTQQLEQNESSLIPKSSRDKIRLSAQQVLNALEEGESNND